MWPQFFTEGSQPLLPVTSVRAAQRIKKMVYLGQETSCHFFISSGSKSYSSTKKSNAFSSQPVDLDSYFPRAFSSGAHPRFSLLSIKMSDLHPSSLDVAFDPVDTVTKRTGCITSTGVCMNHFEVLAFNSGTCRHQPKPASSFTDLGFSFTSRSSGRHTATSGVLDTRSSNCSRIKRTELEGVAKYGSYGIYPEGPKPPVWVLTGETVGNHPIKVFLRVTELDTIEADELPLTEAQKESFELLGLYVGTGECGLGRQACRQKCYVSGKGCRVSTSDDTTGDNRTSDGLPCSCAPCCCPSGDITAVSAGCDFAYTKDCEWEGLHLVRLASNIRSAVLAQIAELLSGVNTGWRTAEVDPLIVDPVDFNPGNLLGLMQWNKNISGAKLTNVLNANAGCPSIKISAGQAAESALALKGLVTLGPEYNSQTTFMQTRLGVVVDLGPATSDYYLAVVTMYVPVMTGVTPLSAPDAGNRLCCLFEDTVVDNSANPTCQPALSYLSMFYTTNDAGEYFSFSIDNVVYSITDESRFIMSFETPVTGTTTGTPRTMFLGNQEFTVTPYSVVGIPGLAIEAVDSDATSISLAVGAQGPLPLTASQVDTFGDLHMRVLRIDNDFLFSEFAIFRRTGLSTYSLPEAGLVGGSRLFLTTPLINADPPAVYTADVYDNIFNSTYVYQNPPTRVSPTVAFPLGYGFSQFVMSSAAVLVSDLDTVAFRIEFINSGEPSWTDETWEFRVHPISLSLSSTLSFSYNRVSPTSSEEVVVQDRQTTSFVLNEGGANEMAFQVVLAIFNGDWVTQLMPCDDAACDTSIFNGLP